MHERTVAFTAARGWHMACIDPADLLCDLADNDIFPTRQEAAMTCNVPTCGTPLTGGGAPRGSVLIRIVGGGEPRRYCSQTCAVRALTPSATVTPIVNRDKGNAAKGAGAKNAADRIRSLGVKPAEIRHWALATGRMTSDRGIIPSHVVDAWVAAHRSAS